MRLVICYNFSLLPILLYPKRQKGFYQTVSAELSQQAFTGHEEYEPDYMSRYYFRSIPHNLQTTDNQSIAGMTAS